ncbi:GntR family transcriptional regulator [Occultella kanbiaonis]|uniref:GntR family transcriptional regulator n=1 Tax=Occultella kanbiaonis TaxID=2675754 RepID=UPI00143CC382|nr:GntR family transcriptional regulator [Occultella kanbiaonis]
MGPPPITGATGDLTLASEDGLGSRVYRSIRERIITGQYEQGARLPESRLATDLQVSRIPLREVLPRIKAEGLITTLPRRTAVVTRWNTQAVHELFDARLAIEVAAVGRAARASGDGAALDRMDLVLQESETEMSRGDDLGFAEANVTFHMALVAASGNSLMTSLMRSISSRMAWLFMLTAQRDHETACREHRELLAAVRSGNERLAESAAYTHIEVGREPSLLALRHLLDDGE